MGNRALVIFHDRDRVSPTVYLHWRGGDVPLWLDELKLLMQGRYGDAEYAAARFIGICHAEMDGNLSLGVLSNSFTLLDVRRKSTLEAETHGDAGVIVVDTSDFSWKAYGGYLTRSSKTTCK
jgi:hypothetical protein